MTYIPINPPFQVFTDLDGEPLEAGFIYIGEENENPVTNPIEVFWDSDGAYPAAQPIRTLAGYMINNGTIANIYFNNLPNENFSISVYNKRKRLIYYRKSGLSDWEKSQENYISITAFGAIGDGVTDNLISLENADNYGVTTLFVPEGEFITSATSDTLDRTNYIGSGHITTNGQRRGKHFSVIDGPLDSYPTATNRTNKYDSVDARSLFELDVEITSNDGNPLDVNIGDGYTTTPALTPFFGQLYISDGVGNDANIPDGIGHDRSGIEFMNLDIGHYGQGDAVCYSGSVFVAGTQTGATDSLAQPAGVLFNGSATSGADHIYLNAGEMTLSGSTYDCSGIGWVLNLSRNDNTAAQDDFWNGIRIQSIGSTEVDSAYFISGRAKVALETVRMIGGTAALAMKATQRIYFNCTTLGDNQITLGDVYSYSNGADIIDVVAGQQILRRSSSTLFITPASGSVGALRVQTSGGTTWCGLGQIGNSCYVSSASDSTDNTILSFRTSVSGVEGDRIIIQSDGTLNYIKGYTAASVPANFTANNYITIQANGTFVYIPCMTSTW